MKCRYTECRFFVGKANLSRLKKKYSACSAGLTSKALQIEMEWQEFDGNQPETMNKTHRDRTRANTLCFLINFFRIWTCKKPADYGPQQH